MTAASQPRFGRMIPAMVTPFDENRELDLKRAQELARRLVEGGADSLIINGTTGESPTVFYPQKIELFKAIVAEIDGQVPVIANVGDNCTQDTVDFAREVEQLGVDGFMLVVPYYNKPPQEGLYQHFTTIANAGRAAHHPLQHPGSAARVNMTAETTLRIANECDNVIAVKEASGDMDQVKGHRRRREGRLQRLLRRRLRHLPNHAAWRRRRHLHDRQRRAGAHEEIVDLCAAGEWEKAAEANERLLPLMKGLFATANPILVKEALKLIGFPVPAACACRSSTPRRSSPRPSSRSCARWACCKRAGHRHRTKRQADAPPAVSCFNRDCPFRDALSGAISPPPL